MDGFTLEVGYQVLFPAYPALRRQVDLAALDLVPLPSAAKFRHSEGTELLGDPLRDPSTLLSTMTSRALTWSDKMNLARLALRLRRGPAYELLLGQDQTILDFLRAEGFSEWAIARFFRPFFGGIFLSTDLQSSARLFRYYLRLLLDGGVALPRAGMSALPQYLAQGLDLRTGVRVLRLQPQPDRILAETSEGDLEARQVVVATDPQNLQALTDEKVPWEGLNSTYLSYAAPRSPEPQPAVLLQSAEREAKLIQCAQWLNQTVPGRAPDGQDALLVTVLGLPSLNDPALDQQVRAELKQWYGPVVESWRTLGIERITGSQFNQPPHFALGLLGHATRWDGVVIASELTSMSSIQGAMESGEKAAAILLNDPVGMSRPRGS